MKTRPRNIRQKIESGGRAFGFCIQFPSPDAVEVGGVLGYDYVWIDAEHGSLGLSEIRDLIRAADAAGIDSIVRVASHDTAFIQQVLDLGATGIMAPHVRTVEEAQQLASAVRYAPLGSRGACPSVRAVGHITTDWAADYTRADSDVLVFGLIEDVEGIENVEEIARAGGLDGLLYGPFDLGMALGLGGDVAHEVLRGYHDRVVNASAVAGIQYVTASLDWEFGALPNTGSQVVTVISDRGGLFDIFGTALAAARAIGPDAID